MARCVVSGVRLSAAWLAGRPQTVKLWSDCLELGAARHCRGQTCSVPTKSVDCSDMDIDPNGENSVWDMTPDNLLVKFVGQFLGLTAAVIVAAAFLFFAWRDTARTVVRAGGVVSLFARKARRQLNELPTARAVLVIAVTAGVVILEVVWLFCVFAVGNLVSLTFGQRDETVLQFDPLDPLGTAHVLQWDAISTSYVLVALATLLVARRTYHREYGAESLGFVVAVPAVLVGIFIGLGVAIRLIVVVLAWLFEGSTALDAGFWTWLIILAGAGAYIGFCLLALRLAVFVGNLWFGDVHNGGRRPLAPRQAVSVQADAYFLALCRSNKNNPNNPPERLNWRTSGWKVAQVTTSDDRSSRSEYLYVTTSGRPVYVDDYGKVQRWTATSTSSRELGTIRLAEHDMKQRVGHRGRERPATRPRFQTEGQEGSRRHAGGGDTPMRVRVKGHDPNRSGSTTGGASRPR
jgi:hypothetical protein